jgi:hypothetical protein
MGGACSTNGAEEERIQVIGGKLEGEKPLGRTKLRRMDNMKIDLGEKMGRYRLDCSGSG